MTKRYADTHWRGALYNALRSAPDGIAGFCAWATEFRDRRIAPKTLYKRLDGSDPAERMSIEDAELITEYLRMHLATRSKACAWLDALNARFDRASIELDVPDPGVARSDSLNSIMEKGLTLNQHGGVLSGLLASALRDRQITRREAEEIDLQVHAEIRDLLRLAGKVRRASECGCSITDVEADE